MPNFSDTGKRVNYLANWRVSDYWNHEGPAHWPVMRYRLALEIIKVTKRLVCMCGM
jgi:hypothetical protein